MSNRNHHYRNPDFNAEQTDRYTLLVQAGIASFSYAIVDENRLLVLEENIGIDELNEPSEEHSILSGYYKQRIIGLPQNGFTFVPVSLFKPELAADFARFLDVKENEKAVSQPLDEENQVIYKANETIVNAIAEKFDIKNTVFSAKGWIELTAANNPTNHDLFVNVDNDQVELLNFRDGKLRFYNSFEFKTADELVYFAMFITEELQLHPQNITLVLSGDISPGDENYNRLAKFFGKVELNNLKTVDLPQEIASHTVLTLTALSLCGSSEAL
ncbi:MAG: hypothetical protein JWQ66_1092 [Mucilaginibacter sp.]|nr:hypothetical protein [Mucilaginibacter sp.]